MTATIDGVDDKCKNAPDGAWLQKARPSMDAERSHPCPLTAALDVIGGKWHLIVHYALAQQPRRFNELQRLTPGVSHKVLTQTVRHLETHALVARSAGASPCVQYSLTERGQTVRPILAATADWGHARLGPDLIGDQRR